MKRFNKRENAVAKETQYALEIVKNKGSDLNQIKNEGFVRNMKAFEKRVPEPFKDFKTIPIADFGKMKTDVLIDYIISMHHDFSKNIAVNIYILTQKVVYCQSDTHPELLTINSIIFLFLHDLLNQMNIEEQFLFPRIRQAAHDVKLSGINDNVAKSLRWKRKLLQNNHAKMFAHLKALREMTNNFDLPPDVSNSYKILFEKLMKLEDNLILHFQLEDDFLFRNIMPPADCG